MGDVELPGGEKVDAKPKRELHPLEIGWDTPSEFWRYLDFNEIVDIKSAQNVYSFCTSDKWSGFPWKEHTDGRKIIDREAALIWVQEHKDEIEAMKRGRGGSKSSADQEHARLGRLVRAARAIAHAA